MFEKLARVLVLLSLLACAAQAADGESEKIFAKANRDYAEGYYGAARDGYEQLVRGGTLNPAVFLNLGHAEFRLGRDVSAAANYQRALALDPGNAAARSSLEHVLGKMGAPAPGLGFADVVGRFVPFDILSLVGSLMVWTGSILLAFALFAVPRRSGLAALAVLAAMLGATAVAVAWAGDSRIALAHTSIVTGEKVVARSTPADNAQKLTDLPRGTPVWVIAGRDDWSLVRLPIGVDGWVPTSQIEPLFPAASAAP